MHDSHLNTPYGQMGVRLMDRWFSNPFPMLPGQNHLCGISTHRLLVKSGSLPPVKYGLWSGARGVGPAKLIESTLDSAVITVYRLAMLFLKYYNWAEDFPRDHPFYLQQDNARMKGAPDDNMASSMFDRWE